MTAPDVRPMQGFAAPVHLGDGLRVLWWGPVSDDDGALDVLALEAGRLLTWPTVRACLADVITRGWASPEGLDELDVQEQELRPVEQWLARRRLHVPAEPSLNLWNLAGDVGETLRLPRSDRSRRADRCYDKLFAAVLPRYAGLESYRPRWSEADLAYLRHRLGRDLALLRRELSQ